MANWTQKLKLHHLEMLVALGEQGNLTHVARTMNIAQPVFSKRLSQLEDEIGITPFERRSKGLRLTEGGKLLLQRARRLINNVERSQHELARLRQGGLVGSLKIGCSPVATDRVSRAILHLPTKMSTLHLNIKEKVMTPLLQDPLVGSVDVVVGRIDGRALQLPLNYQVLYTKPICFAARPEYPLAKCATLSWNDPANWRWIVWPTGTPTRISVDNALVDHGVMLPESTIKSASMNVSTNLSQSSNMISVLPLRLAQRHASQGQLVILNLLKIEQKGSVGVFWRNNKTSPYVLSQFLHFLQQNQRAELGTRTMLLPCNSTIRNFSGNRAL